MNVIKETECSGNYPGSPDRRFGSFCDHRSNKSVWVNLAGREKQNDPVANRPANQPFKQSSPIYPKFLHEKAFTADRRLMSINRRSMDEFKELYRGMGSS